MSKILQLVRQPVSYTHLPYILPVTTSIAKKDNAFYITSGEVKPGIRTPEIVQGEIIPFEKKLGFLNIAVIGIYFALLAWIGYYFSKRQKKDVYKRQANISMAPKMTVLRWRTAQLRKRA